MQQSHPELETFYAIRLQDDVRKLVHIHHGEVVLANTGKRSFTGTLVVLQSIAIDRNPAGQIIGLHMSNGQVRNLWLKRLPDDFGTENPPIVSQ